MVFEHPQRLGDKHQPPDNHEAITPLSGLDEVLGESLGVRVGFMGQENNETDPIIQYLSGLENLEGPVGFSPAEGR